MLPAGNVLTTPLRTTNNTMVNIPFFSLREIVQRELSDELVYHSAFLNRHPCLPDDLSITGPTMGFKMRSDPLFNTNTSFQHSSGVYVRFVVVGGSGES